MNKLALAAFLGAAMCFLLPLERAIAHGTHIWFVSPPQNASVTGQVAFVVEAPYAKNTYIHLRITRKGDEKPIEQGLVTLANKKFSTVVDVSSWPKGAYRAEVILLGGLVQHPVLRDFIVE